VYETTEGCCQISSDCLDSLSDTTDLCIAQRCIHTVGTSPMACSETQPCPDEGPCLETTCNLTAGLCSSLLLDEAGCCATEASCESEDPCTLASCIDFQCAFEENVELLPYWTADFDSTDLSAWAITTDETQARWQLSDARSDTAPNSLYYGRLPQKNYDVGPTSGTITSPIITPQPGAPVWLLFERNIYTEAISSTDKLWLDLIVDGKTFPIWDKNFDKGPGIGWKSVALDITDKATGPFVIRFSFDSVDEIKNDKEGVYIDTIRVAAPCQ